MLIKIITAITIIVLLKIGYNLYYYLLTKWYYKKYVEFTKGSKSWFVKEHKQKIIEVFKKAGIEDAKQPRTEPTGYGYLATSTFSVFRNLSVLNQDIVIIINGNFREAIGVYKQRIFDSLNPIYWFESLIYLPRMILTFLGVKSNNILIKLFQLVWWLIVAISTVIGIIFNQEFVSWIKSI